MKINNMHNKKYIVPGLLSIIILISIIFFTHKNLATKGVASSDLLCPDDYKTDEEATAGMNAFTNQFFDAHPGASLTDWSNARYQFYVDHNCMATIVRYKQAESGKADPATMNRIDQGINDAITNQ